MHFDGAGAALDPQAAIYEMTAKLQLHANRCPGLPHPPSMAPTDPLPVRTGFAAQSLGGVASRG
jgi:hypothetical protein